MSGITTRGLPVALGAVLTGVGMNAGNAGAAPPIDPHLYTCHKITAANEIKPPPPLWQQTGQSPPDPAIERLEQPSQRPCPAGEIAYPKALYRPHGGIPVHGHSVAPPSTPPSGSAGYFYAGNGWSDSGVGASVNVQISQPLFVSSYPGVHSIGQIAVANSGAITDTVEVGWTVDPGAYGNTQPHLFTYVNKDHYATNGQSGGDCYNCNFTPVSGASYKPGQTLNPTAAAIQIAAEYNSSNSGNWWIWFNNQWIGYIPESFWSGNFKSSSFHSDYGEVYDSSQPNTAMGRGALGTQPCATAMNNPFYFPSLGNAANEALGSGANTVPTPSWYNVGSISSDHRGWRFGGAGPNNSVFCTD